jgi:hypothetical protein
VAGSMPHSYGSSLTTLNFFGCSSFENSIVNIAKPIAIRMKRKIGT